MRNEINGPGFDLQVSIPAGELARIKRRLAYLEAVTVQLLREHGRIKEWFTAAELEALGLPGLPATRNAMGALARREGWLSREVRGKGGMRYEYHFSCLPRRPFEALLNRVLRPEVEAAIRLEAAPQVPAIPDPPERAAKPVDATPPWLLPLMRIVRGGQPESLRQAVADLAHSLPPGIAGPTYEEARDYLESIGIEAT